MSPQQKYLSSRLISVMTISIRNRMIQNGNSLEKAREELYDRQGL